MGSKHGEQNKNSVPCLQPLHGAAAPRGSGAALLVPAAVVGTSPTIPFSPEGTSLTSQVGWSGPLCSGDREQQPET